LLFKGLGLGMSGMVRGPRGTRTTQELTTSHPPLKEEEEEECLHELCLLGGEYCSPLGENLHLVLE
jgi:hypothetical protein